MRDEYSMIERLNGKGNRPTIDEFVELLKQYKGDSEIELILDYGSCKPRLKITTIETVVKRESFIL